MKDTHIVENNMLLKKIVRCITKALGDDLNAYLQENRLETNNNLFMHRGDFINQNLRTLIAEENIELIPFKRFTWEGRILIDRSSKVTYTILSNSALKSVQKNNIRTWPHYLHSILSGENAEFKAVPKQLTLEESGDFGPLEFDEDDLKEDYNDIMGRYVEISHECTHYVVTYTAEHGQVQNIQLLLLDKDLGIVESVSLNKYIKLDFSDLTADAHDGTVNREGNIKDYVNVKPGLKTKLHKDEKRPNFI